MSVPLGDRSLFHYEEQGTDGWLRRRLGRVTGSEMKNVIAWKYPRPTKKDPDPVPQPKAERISYKKQLVAQRLIGELGRENIFVNEAMRWGSMNEDIARTNYRLAFGTRVEQVGIIDHPTLKASYSPDGLVGDDGLIEIKCLEPWNHLYTMVKTNEMPDQFKPQVQMGLWITDRQWCDFIGYDSRQPVGLDLFSVRIERDEDYINMLAEETEQFLKEVEADVVMFLKFLPLCRYACKNCGRAFVGKTTVCPEFDCGANNAERLELLEEAPSTLRKITVPTT
jgi:hypothetical protein